MINYKIKKTILIVILLVIVLMIIFFLFYNKILMDNIGKHTKVEDNNITDNNMGLENNNGVDENGMFKNIAYDELILKIEKEVSEYKDSNIYYKKRTYNNILSIYIVDNNNYYCGWLTHYGNNEAKVNACNNGDILGSYVISSYNYDLENKKLLTSEEVLNKFNISTDDFSRQLKEQYLIFYDEDNKQYIEYLDDLENNSNIDVSESKKILNEILKFININTFNVDDYDVYIDDFGKLVLDVNGQLWIRRRPEVSWRQGPYAYKRFIVK